MPLQLLTNANTILDMKNKVNDIILTSSDDISSGSSTVIDLRLSNQETAETATDNTKLMTPLRTKQSITANALLGNWKASGTEAATRSIDSKLSDFLDLRDFYRPDLGDTDFTPALLRIAALSDSTISILLPPTDVSISGEVLFTDKNITIRGCGAGVTRLRCTTASAKIKFLDTSTTSGADAFKRFNVSDLTIQKEHNTTAGNGGIAIEGRWSYAGITFSWEHATFSNVNIQGSGSSRFWDVGIKLIDVGCVRFNNVRIDNGQPDIASTRAAVEFVRDTATNCGQLQFVNCFWHRFHTGLLLSHASGPAGTIEGIYITNHEAVAVRHIIRDDVTSGTTRQVNGVHYTNSHGQVSKSAFEFGYVSNLFIKGGNLTFGVLGDSTASLECAVRASISAQIWSIEGTRFIRNGSATAVPAIILPTRDSVDGVRIVGCSFGAWTAVVNQPSGTTTKDRRRIFVGDDNHRGVSTITPLSTTNSGFMPNAPQIIAQSAVTVSHTGDTLEFTLATISIPPASMGPNGSVRITTVWGATSSANNKVLRVKFDGTSILASTVTTNSYVRDQRQVHNVNSESSQVSFQGTTAGFGATTGAPITTSTNTASAVDITITGQLATTTETVSLISYVVEVLRGE